MNNSRKLNIYVSVFVHVLRFLLFTSKRGRTWALSSEYKTHQAHCTNWMSFLQTNLLEETGPYTEFFWANT